MLACWFSSTFNADAGLRLLHVRIRPVLYSKKLSQDVCVAMSSNLAHVLRKKLFSVFAAAIQGGSLSIHINEPRKKMI
jgi:hypothetical protein